MNRRLAPTLFSLLALMTVPLYAAEPKSKPIAQFTAFAINMNGGPRTNTGVVDISINRWSTDEEREALITTLAEKGSTALLDALTKLPPLGYIRMPNTLGWSLYYARQTDLPDGGRRVIMATNRPLAFGEVARSTRSVQYDFTLVEMHIPKSGKGEGKLAAAAKVSFNNKTHQIEIENYSAMPLLLKSVTEKTPKKK